METKSKPESISMQFSFLEILSLQVPPIQVSSKLSFSLLLLILNFAGTQPAWSQAESGQAAKSNSNPSPELRSAIPQSIAPLKLGSFQGLDIFAPVKSQVLSPLATIAPTGIELQADCSSEVKLKGMQELKIRVKNNTDRPLFFHGDEAIATTGSASLSAASMPELESLIPMKDNPNHYGSRSVAATLSAAVTVGAVQTVTDELIERGPMDKRYGWDNARRMDRQSRFSKRVLWPGDSSEGLIYFKSGKNLAGASLELKVSDYYDKADSALLKYTVK